MTDQATSPRLSKRLDLLYRLSQTFNSSLDLEQVLNTVMDEVIAAVKAERGFVMLFDDDDCLAFKVARGIDQQTINDPQFQVSRSIVERVAREGEAVLTSDAQSDERFSMRQSVRLLGLRSILCVPLILAEKTLGVIYVDNRLHAGIFSPSDLELLAAIGSNAAIAIENARLYQLAVEKGRLERELQMARQVQASLLPSQIPQLTGWDFSATWLPARQVAGDYYDFVHLENGDIGLVIGDVTDKGMPSALFMALTRTIVRASMNQSDTPLQAITHANRLICSDSTNGMFVTLFCAQINPGEGVLSYVNAGHNPPLYYHHSESAEIGQLALLERTGMALGVSIDEQYQQGKIRMSPGDFVFLYTDGITDALNEHGNEYGLQNLQQVTMQNRSNSASVAMTNVVDSLRNFTGGEDPFDDITITMVKRNL